MSLSTLKNNIREIARLRVKRHKRQGKLLTQREARNTFTEGLDVDKETLEEDYIHMSLFFYRLDDKHSELQDKHSELQEVNDELQLRVDALIEENESMNEQLDKQKRRYAYLKEGAHHLTKNNISWEDEHKSMSSKLSKVEAINQSLILENTGLQAHVRRLEKDPKATTTAIKELRKENHDLQLENEGLSAASRRLEKEIEQEKLKVKICEGKELANAGVKRKWADVVGLEEEVNEADKGKRLVRPRLVKK